MNPSRVVATTSGQKGALGKRRKDHRTPSRANTVLGERNQAVVAVGAWVESGEELLAHPVALALLTEELQAEKKRENEKSLQRFQDDVRQRVAQQAQLWKNRQQTWTDTVVTGDRRIIHRCQTHHVSAGEKLVPVRVKDRHSQESCESTKQVRLRLAACRVSQHEDMTSDFPGGKWTISPTRHKEESHVRGDDKEGSGDIAPFISPHECPLAQQKASGCPSWDADSSHPDDFRSGVTIPHILWPLINQEELKKQRQSQFLMHRRLVMNTERARAKESKEHRKHLKRTARIKAEKEHMRLEEERRLEKVQQLEEARQNLQEREMLILERLKLEEEERTAELQRRKREEKGKVCGSSESSDKGATVSDEAGAPSTVLLRILFLGLPP
ncbi:uncharacterized protein ccdc15 isoform 2-T2 [Pholidichthys leucotaenia]